MKSRHNVHISAEQYCYFTITTVVQLAIHNTLGHRLSRPQRSRTLGQPNSPWLSSRDILSQMKPEDLA